MNESRITTAYWATRKGIREEPVEIKNGRIYGDNWDAKYPSPNLFLYKPDALERRLRIIATMLEELDGERLDLIKQRQEVLAELKRNRKEEGALQII